MFFNLQKYKKKIFNWNNFRKSKILSIILKLSIIPESLKFQNLLKRFKKFQICRKYFRKLKNQLKYFKISKNIYENFDIF